MITRHNRAKYIAVRNFKDYTTILLVKDWFRIVTLASVLLVAGQANASDLVISFDNPLMTREEHMVKLQVEKHRMVLPATVRTIDGAEPAVQISDTRTSLPDEYVTMPRKLGDK